MIPAILFIGAVVLFVVAHTSIRHMRLVKDLPTSKAHGVFMGLVELKGTAESDHPKISRLTKSECVTYSWSVEEEWGRWVQVTYKDSEGKSRTKMEYRTGWTNIASGEESIPFYLQDESGWVKINPENSCLTMRSVMDSYLRESDSGYSLVHAAPIMDSTGKRHYKELLIEIHENLYVMGTARFLDDENVVEIAADTNDNSNPFIITYHPELTVVWSLGCIYGCMLMLSAIMTFLGCFILFQEETLLFAGCMGAWVLLWLLSWFYTKYCSMIDLKNRVSQAYSNIEVQLKRRYDLLPALNACVSQAASYERNLQEYITRIRQNISQSQGTDLYGCSSVLKSITEAYPEMTANENFLAFQRELVSTEQKIALARAYYNDIVQNYNIRLQVFPDNVITLILGLKQASYINAVGLERDPTKIDFV